MPQTSRRSAGLAVVAAFVAYLAATSLATRMEEAEDSASAAQEVGKPAAERPRKPTTR